MRLITRSDFDGLMCAVLLVEKGIVDEFMFAHPKDVQHGEVAVTKNDVLANLPYAEECGMWFDHHESEILRLRPDIAYEGANRATESTAQIVWDYYGGEETFGKGLAVLLEAVNKSDAARFTREEILEPTGWGLLSFILDPRTGLGRFSDFSIGNYQLMLDMIQHCRTKTADEILALPDVEERTKVYFEQQDSFKEMVLANSAPEKNLVVTDLRSCETICAGNRFIVYALFPEQNIDLRIMWGKQQRNVVFSCGRSILNRTCTTNVGRLMLEYGGGGHEQVGTCQVPREDAERIRAELIEKITGGAPG